MKNEPGKHYAKSKKLATTTYYTVYNVQIRKQLGEAFWR